MKYFILTTLLTSFSVSAQNFSPSAGAGVPQSTAPGGAGTVLNGASPATSGAGNFTSPSATINTGNSPVINNPGATSPTTPNAFGQTFGDGSTTPNTATTPNSSLTPVPSTTAPTTPSNNPIQQSQEAVEFSTLPESTNSPSGDTFGSGGTNTTSPVETFPGATPSP